MKELEIYIDGASVGNPGPAGIGVAILENGQVIKNISVYLGIQTNNLAEYFALIYALQEALILRISTVRVYTDSELLYRQINNEYKIKSPNLLPLYQQFQHLLAGFAKVEVKHIPRDMNRQADKLAKKAIKDRLKEKQFKQAKVAALHP